MPPGRDRLSAEPLRIPAQNKNEEPRAAPPRT